MHLYLSCSKLFIFFVLTNYGVLTDSTEDESAKDPIFADVIKNITRVNNVLQDLIKNYEKLQKIYKSQETIESFSNEEEGEELFRGRHNKLKKNNNEESTTKYLPFPATKMMVSSEESVEEIKKPKAREEPKINNFKKGSKENKATTENEIVSESSSDESDSEDEKSNKPITKSNKKATSLKINDATENIKAKVYVTKPSNQTKTIKKQIIQTEKFSENNIWSEMVNKPVNLQKEKEIIYSKRKADKNDPYFRNDMDKKGSTNITKKEVKANITLTSGSVENDKIIKKEEFKTAILRKAYGDACLKVVVKKCYKACRQAVKDHCARYSCKSSFKTSFKEHSKTGCIKEFRELEEKAKGKESSQSKKKKDDSVHIRADASTEFLEITRNGYLAAACLPNSNTAQNVETNPKRRSSDLDMKLNILRDRFERACQETSSNKCDTACKFAIKETCSSHECQNRKKGDLKKSCRKTCDDAYKSKYSSGSDSGSSGSDSSSRDSGRHDKRTTQYKRQIKIKTTKQPKRRMKIISTTPNNAIAIKTKSTQSSRDANYKPTPKDGGKYKDKALEIKSIPKDPKKDKNKQNAKEKENK